MPRSAVDVWMPWLALMAFVNLGGLVMCTYNSASGRYWKDSPFRPQLQLPMINDKGYTVLGYSCVWLYQCFWAASGSSSFSTPFCLFTPHFWPRTRLSFHTVAAWHRSRPSPKLSPIGQLPRFLKLSLQALYLEYCTPSPGLTTLRQLLSVPAAIEAASLVMILYEQLMMFEETVKDKGGSKGQPPSHSVKAR